MPHTAPAALDRSTSRTGPRNPWSWSIKAMLMLTLLVAVYLAGRVSSNPNFGAPMPGTWQLKMPVGAQRPVTLSSLGPGKFLLRGTTALDGAYQWSDKGLIADNPKESRMVGLVWIWDHDELVLAAVTPRTPTGSPYLGARLAFVTEDTSPAAKSKAATIDAALVSPSTFGPPRMSTLEGFVADPWKAPEPGLWQLQVRPTTGVLNAKLQRLPGGEYELTAAGVFTGVYHVQDNRLKIKTSKDNRMTGLAWAWQDDELVLVSEPANAPTGSRYLGARMRQRQPDEP